MKKVYLIECEDLHYVCDVCNSLKTAKIALRYYHEVIGKSQQVYKISIYNLIDSSFNSLFERQLKTTKVEQ